MIMRVSIDKDFIIKHKWPLLIVAMTLLVRLVYLLELSSQPGFLVPMVDERWHWEWAHEILEKSFFGEDAYFRAPLYPYFLAFLAFVTSGSIFWAKVLQILVTAGTSLFVYRLAFTLFDQRAAIISGLAYALYGTLVFYETMFLIPGLFLFFTVWGMYRLVSQRGSESGLTWFTTGIIFGLAAISRPNILVVLPFLMLWLYVSRKQIAVLARRAAPPLWIALGILLMILPVTVRNLAVTGEFMLISSQGGINLYLGNNEVADGLTMLMPEVDLDESLSWSRFIPVTQAAAEREAGHSLTAAQQSSFWTGKAIDFIFENPGKFLSLVLKKSAYLISGFENSDNSDLYYQRTKSILYSGLLFNFGIYFPFGILLPAALAGMYLTRRRIADTAPLCVFVVAYIPTIVFFLVTARHRLPLVPFLIVLAAGGVTTLLSSRTGREVREVLMAALIFVGTLIIVNRTFFDAGTTSAFQTHYNNGLKCERLEDFAGAEQEYRLAAAEYPYSAPLLNNLGNILYRQKKDRQADSVLHLAIKQNPDYPLPYNNLGKIQQRRGNNDSAVVLFDKTLARIDTVRFKVANVAQVYVNKGGAFETLNMIDSAEATFMTAATVGNMQGKVVFGTAAFLARVGRHRLVDSLYLAGSAVHELRASDFFNWGLSLIERKQFSLGVSQMQRALKRDKELYQAYYAIAVAYLEGNMPLDSVQYQLDQSLLYNPDFVPALELRKKINSNRP